ncbi:putative Protein-export membrane protein SecD [groundwater metagenome]|uniref:Protein export membrane protein SecD/SecF C-terminal domain-containing protein n=1 Tax=groundwater metagenome TaxID=717931 RepID=A0A098E6Z5_9ZZZZ
MERKSFIRMLKNIKILLLLTAIILSAVFLYAKPLNFGSDFVGGVYIELELEHSANSTEEMQAMKTILENRLNGMGLRDIQVITWGDQFLVVKMAKASPEQINEIESIIMRQAKYIERVDGKLALKGDELTLDTSSSGVAIVPTGEGYHRWQVAVIHNLEGAKRFGEAIAGKMGRPIDSFIDAPENTSILLTEATYKRLHSMTSFKTLEDWDIAFHGFDNGIYIIENRSLIQITQIKTIKANNDENNKSTAQEENFDFDDLEAQLEELKNNGINTIIIAQNKDDNITIQVENFIAENGFKVIRKPKGDTIYAEWIKELTGLQSSPRLNFFSSGPVYNAVIEGISPTKADAEKKVIATQVLLSSGNLPVKILPICGTTFAENTEQCGGKETTFDPTLGGKFLSISAIIGIIAIIVVSIIIFIRYRKMALTIPVMLTCLSEIIIILGFASMIHWELDLLAIAGIIIVVGTGVDNQIVILDETLKRGKKKEVVSIVERIKSAFFIIFVSAGTIIVVMLALMGVEAGMLKGFAFTTIAGVLIGVIITRPAFAKIVEYIVK